ncbi:MAG TPA: DUF2723 domain-containing protein [Thermoanaerobaculia bacterium]|nr:DUF2723 domain-containing protein [Thermoanaerobaculia bacterium]
MTRPPARAWIEGALLAVVLFLLYSLGASRTIYVGDSGELVAAVHTLGIPHPTGYPLYVLLGKLWTLAVPVGSIAFRMSLFAAACAAAAGGGLYLLGRRLELDAAPAFFAALSLGLSPSFWGEANVQRVYSLNALFLVAATAAAVEWHRRRRPSHLVLTCFLAALGATNHTFMAFFGIAFAVWAMATDRSLLRRPHLLAAAAGATLAGLLPYLYLPLRSRADPALDWGNPETLSGFLDVVLRRGFWRRAWLESPADLLPIGADYLSGLGRELLWVGALLAVAGALHARRRRWPIGLLGLVMAANLGTMAVHGSRSDLFVWHRYYIPSYVMAALLAGLGCQALWERLPRRLRWAPLLLPAVLLVFGYPRFDRSRYRIAEDFSRTLLASLPPGAHLIASDDNILFVLLYLQLVEGLRPDVDLILQGVGGPGPPPLRFDPDTDPLYLTHHPNWTLPSLEVVPVGLVFRAVRAGGALPAPAPLESELDGEHDPRVPKDHLTRNLIGDFHYMLGITEETRDWPRAAAELELASAVASDNDVLHYNLGLIYRRNGLHDRALAAFERAAAINPRHLPSDHRVRAADRVAEQRSELERLRPLERAIAETIDAAAAAASAAPASAVASTPERHRRLAAALEAHGEPLAARGHLLRAQEIASGRAAHRTPSGGRPGQ